MTDAELLAMIQRLEGDERRLVEVFVSRLEMGRAQYGVWRAGRLPADDAGAPCDLGGARRPINVSEVGMSGIIIGGEELILEGADVQTWHDTGMTFDIRHAPRRREAVRWCVLHWTASEREGIEGAKAIHRNLQARGLSVEFAITNDGTIWQFVDPIERRCRHCSRVNPYSVGVEVSGIGWAKPGRPLIGQAALRQDYTATVHGWRTQWLDYLPAQHEAMAALARGLCEAIPTLERRVELAPFERRSDAYFEEHSGFCGHLHAAWLSKRNPKCDPGPRPLEELAKALVC